MRSHLSTEDCRGEEQRGGKRKRGREGCGEVKGEDGSRERPREGEADKISSLSTV